MKNRICSHSLLNGALLALATLLTAPSMAQNANDASWDTPADPELHGTIEKPLDNSDVERNFTVTGSITNGRYRHLWLLVRIRNSYWPKEPELRPRDGRWSSVVSEGGTPPGGNFEIVLMDVSEAVSNTFSQWFQTGHNSGHYPSLKAENLGNFMILDTMRYHLRTN